MFVVFSAKYGMGHQRAADAIVDALREWFPEETGEVVDYLSLLPPHVATNTLRVHHWLTRYWPWGYGAMYDVTGRLSAMAWWQRIEERPGLPGLRTWIAQHQPRAILATHPMPLMGLAALRRAGWLRAPVIGVITDYVVHPSWLHPGVDGYAAPHLDAAKAIVDRLGDQVTVRVTGIPIRAEFRHPPSGHRVRERWGWDARPRVLVNLGSYGMAVPKARRLVRALDQLTPAAVLVLFTGHDEAVFQALTREATQHRDWVVRGYQDNMEEWLSAVDVVVTPAGALTLTEVARLRRPLVIYQPRPGQELGNARWFQRQGAAVMAFSADEAREAVQQLLTQRDAAEQLTTRMAALVPTNAARQVVAFVEELMTSKGNKGANPSI